MKRLITPFHAICAMIGVGLLSTDLLSNVEYMLAQTQTLYDTNILAVVMAGVGAMIALPASFVALRQKHVMVSLIVAMGYVFATTFSLTATLDRVATQRDARMQEIYKADTEWSRLNAIEDEYSKAMMVECRTGRGIRCEGREGQVERARERRVAHEGRLDSSGKRLAYYLAYTGLTAEHFAMWQPILLPVTLLLLGPWLFAFGINGVRAESEFAVLDEGAEQEAKADRFIREYIGKYDRKPPIATLKSATGLGTARARRILATA